MRPPGVTKYWIFRENFWKKILLQKGLQTSKTSSKIVFSNKPVIRRIIDEGLTFAPHITHIKSKLRPLIFTIKRMRHRMNEKTALQVYFAHSHIHILSHLTFMNPLWSVANQTDQSPLYILQKKIFENNLHEIHRSPPRLIFSRWKSFHCLCSTTICFSA